MVVVLKRRELCEHILRRNLSQNAFAAKAGLSKGYMTQLMRGNRKPSPAVRERLMKASGLDFDRLFEITPEREGDYD